MSSRHRRQKSHSHRITRIAQGHYRLSWTVDYYVAGSRIRLMRTTTRDTDAVGAAKFATRWKIDMPPISTGWDSQSCFRVGG